MESAMTNPYIIGIWQGSLIDAANFINKFYLGDNVIQFIPDTNPRGYWLMLRVTGDQGNQLREIGARATPRWSFLP
jgi:hypothetical protein